MTEAGNAEGQRDNMKMRIYGLDFTSLPSRSKPLTLAVCDLEDSILRLLELRPLGGEKAKPFKLFEEWLQTPGPWVAGVDFPFSQPRQLVLDLGWPTAWGDFISHVAGLKRSGFESGLRAYKASKLKGEKELHRATDKKAISRSPMKLENPPVGKMFFEGASRLLLSGASVLPVRPVDGETRIVVEAYPALVARKWIGRKQGYKHDDKRKCDDDMRFARCDIVQAIRGRMKNDCRKSVVERYGLAVEMSDEDAEACIGDGSGDQLDSVLCAVQAGWAYRNRDAGYGIPGGADQLEGWIVDPDLAG